jgi:hypothetical protein
LSLFGRASVADERPQGLGAIEAEFAEFRMIIG